MTAIPLKDIAGALVEKCQHGLCKLELQGQVSLTLDREKLAEILSQSLPGHKGYWYGLADYIISYQATLFKVAPA